MIVPLRQVPAAAWPAGHRFGELPPVRQGLPQQYPPLAGVAVDGFTGCCEDAIPINCVGLSSLNSESCQHFVSVLPERRVGDEVDVDCRCQGKPCRKARADTLMLGSGLGGSVELGVICVEELHKGQSGSRRSTEQHSAGGLCGRGHARAASQQRPGVVRLLRLFPAGS